MSTIVVSDTSPITNLAAVGQLELLHSLYGKITIPEKVYDEIVIQGRGNNPGAAEVRAGIWIETQKVTNVALVQSLISPTLHPGEVEAVVLASELNADLVLIDDARGRAFAARYGLKYTGLLGVLLTAKARGVIPLVRPVLDALRAGPPGPEFWVSDKLYIATLQQAGERP